MAYTTITILDGSSTSRTWQAFLNASNQYVSATLITDGLSNTLFTSAAPGVISAASLPLPTGASTSSNQTSEINLLTEIYGVLNSGIVVVEDLADGSVSGGAAGTKSQLAGGVYNSAPITLTNGQQSSHQLDANGYLKVNVVTGGGSGGNAAASATGSAVPADAGYTGVNVSGNLVGVTGKTVGGTTGADVDINSVGGSALAIGQQLSAASIPVVLPAAQITSLTPPTTVAVTQSTSPWVVTLTSTTITGTVAATQSGTWNVGTVTTVTTVGAVTAITNALPTGANTIGGVTITSSATGGCSTFHLVATGSTNATNIKSSAGTLKGVQVYNAGAAIAYLKFYDSATAVTAGTGTPKKVVMIPGNPGSTGAGAAPIFPPEGIVFASGISFTTTSGIADADSSTVAASTFLIEVDYK